jgi:hypothetical protein
LLSPKCSKTYLRASLIRKIFPGVIPPDPRSKGREWEERKRGRGEEREGRGEGWEGNRIERKGREWKGRGGRKRGGKGWTPRGPGPPKIFGLEPPLVVTELISETQGP